MPGLRVTFTLSDSDQKHLRAVLRRATAAAKTHSEEEILGAALATARAVEATDAPTYVTERIAVLGTMVDMVRDKDWVLPGSVRLSVLTALAYFVEPADLIPDQIPGFGFLDDAIMIQLMALDLRHELDGYRDFSRFRDKELRRRRSSGRPLETRLVTKRKQLRRRIQGRQNRA
jgi:uncharacterized membrane protein YkvA (DUF1232 family)